MKLPEGALIDSRYDNMSAEAIYNVLAKEKQEQDKQKPQDSGDGTGKGDKQQQPSPKKGESMGEVQDAPVQSEAELIQAEAQAKQELAQAIQIAKQQGNLPAGIERIVNEILKPRIAWQEVLARFIDQVAKSDYSFSKPNVRYLSSGFILPSLYNLEVGEIVLIVDTSGSIDIKLLNLFAGEMQEVCSTTNTPIRVLYVNNRFQGEQIIEPDDTFKLNAKGGGGTDFRPGFEYMEKEGITPKAVVYFTDMACSSFPAEPEYPILWGKYGSCRQEPPFGEVIQVDQ
jgi:predicted metal-dependent peptidase